MYRIDKNEIIWERIYGEDERLHYLITSDRRREEYYLYEVSDDGVTEKKFKKIGKGKNPPDLYRKYMGVK